MNIRFFSVSGAGREAIVDTLGSAAFGLPDLQLQFHGLERKAVEQYMGGMTLQIFENGFSGLDEVGFEGMATGSKWTARRDWSLVEPERHVLDLQPGIHAASAV